MTFKTAVDDPARSKRSRTVSELCQKLIDQKTAQYRVLVGTDHQFFFADPEGADPARRQQAVAVKVIALFTVQP